MAARSGIVYTFYQLINGDGELLRVTGSVKDENNEDIIFRLESVDNPESSFMQSLKKDSVIFIIMDVLGEMHRAMLKPVKDNENNIIGILCLGVELNNIELRQSIIDVVVGKTGYVYVLGGKGRDKGHYIISMNGERDGLDIYNAMDANGNHFVKEIIDKAVRLKVNETDYVKYSWKNAGELSPRLKIVCLAYYEPWDWIIGANMYEDDFYEFEYEMIK